MNTISTMLKPLRTALEAVEALGLADDEYTVGLRAAIAAGEAELRREPDYYRAILSASLREQIHTRLHVIGCRDRKSGEDFVESEKTFGGWDYTLEPLYTREETK